MTSSSIPKADKIGRAKITPKNAIKLPPMRVIKIVEPTTARTFSIFCAPHAWPTKTVEPADSPITKAIKQNRMGKNTATAAIACTPIICPTKMVLIVPDRFCRILVAIKGIRKIKKAFHSFCCCTNGVCADISHPEVIFITFLRLTLA